MGRSILHAFMRKGWKKSSVMRLFCYLGHGTFCITIILLASMADHADLVLMCSMLVGITIIGTQVLDPPLLEAVDREKRPMIPRFGWFMKGAGLVLLGEIACALVWPPRVVRAHGIPYPGYVLAVLIFLAGVLLVGIALIITCTPPLGHVPDQDD